MLLDGKNYWEQGATPKERALAMLAAAAANGNPNPNPGNGLNVGTVVAPDPGSQVAAAEVQAQQGPVPQDDVSRHVQEALAANADNPGVYPWDRPYDALGQGRQNLGYDAKTGIDPAQLATQAIAASAPPKPVDIGSSDNPNSLAGMMARDTVGYKVNDAVGDAAGGIWDAIKGIGQSVAEQANYAESPMGIYEKLRRETPGYSYNGPSAADMAKNQFSPLFQMLTQQAAQDKTRYEGAREKAKQSYAGFIKDLLASQKSDQAAFTQAGVDIGANNAAAAKSVTDNTTASAKALSAELAQLGIGEGAGTLFAKNQKNLTDTLGRLSANGQTAANVNSQLKANEYASDSGNINTSRQAGLNYQSDLYNGYLDQMNQNDQQRLQLQGQQGQAQNQYEMQIQDLLQKGQAASGQNIDNVFKTIMQNQQRTQENDLANRQFGLAQDKFGLDVQKYDDSRNPNSNNAYRTLEADALQRFGGDQNAAATAAQTLLNALSRAPQATDIGTLLAQIPEEELRKPHMADLAYAFFNSVLNNKGL